MRMVRMKCGALCMFAITIASLLLTIGSGKHRKHTKMSTVKQDKFEKPSRRTSISLPTLDQLFTARSESGTKFRYEGCDIISTHSGNTIKLDLKDKKCQDVMSVPRLYGKLTGNNLEDSALFLPLKKFNVEGVNLDVASKEVSLSCVAKESFTLFRGTSAEVNKARMTLSFIHGEDVATFDSIGFDVYGEVPVNEQTTLSLSLIKKKSSQLGEFSLETDAVKIKDFYDVFTQKAEEFEKRDDTKPDVFAAMFADVTLTKPKITGTRDAKGNCELAAAATGSKTKTKITCEAFVDVAFIVDSSGSVRKDFDKEKQFIKSLASAFQIDTQGVRAGVITFSSKPVIDIKLNQFNDTKLFDAAVDDIPHMASSTNIHKALRLADRELFTEKNGARNGIPKLVILITDGTTTARKAEDPEGLANQMRKKGIQIVVIGIGKKINATELEEIAGDKSKMYNTGSFDELVGDEFLDTATKAVCSEVTAGTPIDEAFDQIKVVRSRGTKGKISITLSNGTTSTGEIYESGNVHSGFMIFPDGQKHTFWYYSLEATVYWGGDKGTTEHTWRGRPHTSAASLEFPGLQQGTFHIIVQIQRGKPAEASVIVKYDQIKPATVIAKLTNKDVKNVPLINDVTVDAILEYANADIGAPSDDNIVKVLKEFSPTSGIDEGTKLKFKVPFKKLIEKNGVSDTTSANLDQYVRIVVVNNRELSFEFPENSPMNLEDILLALGVKLSLAFKKVFPKKIAVKISTFEVNLLLDVVNVVIDTTDAVVVGNNLLSVEKATFVVKRVQSGGWVFDMKSEMTLGDGRLKIEVKQAENEYSLTGTISHVNTLDLVEHFKITTSAGKVIKSMSSFNLGVINCVLYTDFADKLQLRMTGQATFLRWTISFEGYIVKNEADEYVMTYGLVLPNIAINDVATEMFSNSGKQIELIKAEWLSKLSVSIMVGNHGEVDFQTPELKQMLENTKKPFQYSATSSEDGGASIYATVVIPQDCRGETLCEFTKRAVGSGTRLELVGNIYSIQITLKVSFRVDIKISEKFTLKEASLMMSVGDETEFSITGVCEVTFEKTKMLFKARLKEAISGKFTLAFSMAGIWQNPFGTKNMQFGNFQITVGMNFITLQQPFLLTGEMHFGYPGTAMKAQLFGALESGLVPGYYFYAKYAKVSIKDIFEAFNVQRELPKPIRDIGFPDGLIAGISAPKGQRIEMLNVDLQPVFVLQGECTVLGLNMYCELTVDLPTTFRLKAEFPKIHVAGGAVELSGLDQRSGPKLEITLGAKFGIQIDAYVEVLKIGAGVRIEVSDSGLQFQLVGRFLDLFEARLTISAPYGSLVSMEASQWRVTSCISDYVRERITDGAVNNVVECTNATTSAQQENTKVNGESTTWFNKAMEKVNYWKRKLLDKEKDFQEEIAKIEKSKKDLDQSCVAKCDKRKVWVGGFGVKTCVVAGRNVQCPYWIPEKTLRDDPLCLADCEAGRFKLFSKIGSFFKTGDLMIMEEKMSFYSKMLDKVQSFVMSSKYLIENAELASKKVGEMVAAAGDALNAIRSYTLKNLFYLHHLCISATLEHAGKGLCFSIDTEFYIGGKNGKKIAVKEEACFNLNWVYEIGRMIARKAFPGIESIKEKYKQTKELFTKSEKQASDIGDESKDIEKRDICGKEDKNGSREKKCKDESIHKKLLHYRSQDVYDSLPDVVVRNDESMQAFRDLFETEVDHLTRSPVTDTDTMVDGRIVNGMNFDPATRQHPDNCKRAQGVMNTYAGILESINLLMAKNNNVKQSYEKFIKEYSNTFDALERKIRNESITNNMSGRDTENALFYVTKAKQGIGRWKTNYDLQYENLDRSSLQNWRGFMGGFVGDKKLNIDSYILGTTLKETNKRMEVPTNVKKELSKSLSSAEQVVRSLLQEDNETFSSKTPSIRLLVNQVNNMNNIKKKLNCS